MIQIHYLDGPNKGLHATFNESPLSFGRSGENPIVIDMDVMSRKHGELRIEGDDLIIENLSPNGTTVNGKPVRKPQKLRNGDVVGVGKAQLFAVQYNPVAAAKPVEEVFDFEREQAQAQAAAPQKGKKPNKLWVFIGIYLVVILGVFIVLALSSGGSGKGNNRDTQPQMTNDQIEAELTAPIKHAENQAETAKYLRQANLIYDRMDGKLESLYQIHLAYKLALAYSGKSQLEGADHLRFKDVERQLVERIKEDYFNAYAALSSGEYELALQRLEALAKVVTDPASKLGEMIQKHITFARNARRRR